MDRPAHRSGARTTPWRRWLCRLFASVAVALSLVQTSHAQEDVAVAEFVARINQSVRSLGSAQGYERALGVCLTMLRSALNVDAVASTVAAGSWARMTPQQRTSFRTAVENRIGRDCARNRGSQGESLTFVGIRRGNDGDRLLATRWGTADKGRTVIWRVRSSGERLRAVDVLMDGRSLVLALTNEARETLDRTNGNIDALLSAM